MVFVVGSQGTISQIDTKTVIFLVLSGLATGDSWLCCYKALQDGLASVVVPIDKLSILVTVAFSYFVFKEKLTKKSALGLLLIVAGTLTMIIKRSCAGNRKRSPCLRAAAMTGFCGGPTGLYDSASVSF